MTRSTRSALSSERLIVPLPGNETLAQEIAVQGGWDLGALETRRFPDGETYVRILEEVRDRAVDLVCTLVRPDDGFLRLVFAADAARGLGAREVTLIAPYLAYMRQDRRFQPGEAVTSKTFARLVSLSFDRLVTVDPHLHRYAALSDLYDIPTETLHAAPLLADWIAANVEAPLVIGPDAESEQWVSAIAGQVGAPYTVLRKTRHGDRKVVVDVPDLSPWRGRQPVLVDDIASSGRTLAEAAAQLPAQDFAPPVVAVVHGIFAEDALERLKPLCRTILSTDSASHPTNAIPLAPLIARAVRSEAPPSPPLVRHRRPPEPPDEVDQAGIESFPASDPPAWMGGAT